MKSRISIDLNENNEPIIQIVHVKSDDVRDKMVSRFLEKLSGSPMCRIYLFNPSPENATSISHIYPVPYGGLREEVKVIDLWLKEHEEK